MSISLIACIANNRTIGKDGKIPWHLPSDLKFFKETTLNSSIIMGRKTFQSLPGVLPQRFHIVLSRKDGMLDNTPEPGNLVITVNSKDAALTVSKFYPNVFVIGGEDIYKLFIDVADRIYLSVLPINVDGDAFFPEIDLNDWKIVSTELVQDNMTYKRIIFDRKII